VRSEDGISHPLARRLIFGGEPGQDFLRSCRQFFTVIVSESTAFLPVIPSSPASRPR